MSSSAHANISAPEQNCTGQGFTDEDGQSGWCLEQDSSAACSFQTGVRDCIRLTYSVFGIRDGTCQSILSTSGPRFATATEAINAYQTAYDNSGYPPCTPICVLDEQDWTTVRGSPSSDNYGYRSCVDATYDQYEYEVRWDICSDFNNGPQIASFPTYELYTSALTQALSVLEDMWNAATCNDPPDDPPDDPPSSSCEWGSLQSNQHYFYRLSTPQSSLYCWEVRFGGCEGRFPFYNSYSGQTPNDAGFSAVANQATDAANYCLSNGLPPYLNPLSPTFPQDLLDWQPSQDDDNPDDPIDNPDDPDDPGDSNSDSEVCIPDETGRVPINGPACERTLRDLATDDPAIFDVDGEFAEGQRQAGFDENSLESDIEFQRRNLDHDLIGEITDGALEAADGPGAMSEAWDAVRPDFDRVFSEGSDRFPFGIAGWIEDAQPSISGSDCPVFTFGPLMGYTRDYSLCDFPIDTWLSTVFRTLVLAVMFGIFIIRIVGQIIITI